MLLGGHLSPRARAHIEAADVVFAAVSDPLVEVWLQQMHRDVRSLQPLYSAGKSRRTTYREMVDAMLAEARAGKRVCGAFYGHPGVFAWAPHAAIARARREGLEAAMEPGISAEDCLYADLGIDPGRHGCQHYEASQFMFYRRRFDPSAYLVLWQVGIAGDRSYTRFETGPEYRQVLVDLLLETYPGDHEVIVYEAATLAIAKPRVQAVPLMALAQVPVSLATTLVIPPSQVAELNPAVVARLERLDVLWAASKSTEGECVR